MKKRKGKSINKTFITSLVLLIAIAGVATTIAIATAQSNMVTNEFGVAKIDTEIEENIGPDLTKQVKVTNTEMANSSAYVRVRLTMSPESDSIHLIAKESGQDVDITSPEAGKSVNGWEYFDGFWYYLLPVEPSASTSELLDHLQVDEGFTDSFDVVVYQESCIASGDATTAQGIKAIFDKATISSSTN